MLTTTVPSNSKFVTCFTLGGVGNTCAINIDWLLSKTLFFAKTGNLLLIPAPLVCKHKTTVHTTNGNNHFASTSLLRGVGVQFLDGSAAFKDAFRVSEAGLETMTSVLNVGVMGNNPAGIQIRRLEAALETERKDKAMLLLALETKAPEVFAEYMRMKEEEAAQKEAAARAADAARNATTAAPPRYNPNRGRGF